MESRSTTRRACLLGSVAFAGLVGTVAWPGGAQVRQPWADDIIDVRRFGASPDASAEENTRAFAVVGQFLSRRGGGTVLIPPGEYLVGVQEPARRRGRQFAYRGADILTIEGCAGPTRIIGHGATLKARPGLRYGAFDPVSGAPHHAKPPFYDHDYRGEAYRMLVVRNCTGPVRVEGLELDGNLSNLVLGGPWGDVGRQLPAIGIYLDANQGEVTIEAVNSHHHGQDGIMVLHHHLTPASPRYQVNLLDSTFDSNGRQGLSWVGGTGLTARRCRFNRTGRAGIFSPPGAGVDVEAELSVCRNGLFVECEFADNAGVGFLAESGDSADIRLDRCTFIGTTNWSVWPKKPRVTFNQCVFVGSIVNVYGSPDPALATRFSDCRFKGDNSLSPDGKIYGGYLADLGGGAANVIMERCEFDASARSVALLWSAGDVTFDSCRFRQASTLQSYPRGIYRGRNEIVSRGPVELSGSKIVGELLLNGKRV
jgi:hypothetical protein